jgi:hypothetical protein
MWRGQESPYRYLSEGFVGPTQPQGGSFWETLLSKTKQKSMDYFSDPRNVMGLGMGAVGGIAGYMSAKAAEKRQKQYDDYRMQLARKQNARFDASEATRLRYDDPLLVEEEKLAAVDPSVNPRGETAFYLNNQLSRSRAPAGTKTIFAAEGGYMEGGTTGQSDKIPAMLSDGEFVMDAETVAMLGDGNNAAGASALEQMRQNIRKQKRSAPANKIPPKAKKPEQYMKKGKK